ncbi:MAG: ATP synthase subunit I [Desulfovermiculus sp.]|nr:ATP synthase subunit I [Desulfovermiculus sp.]
MNRLREKSKGWLRARGIDHPGTQWLVMFQAGLAGLGTAFLVASGLWNGAAAFGTGALLATGNFYFLAKLVPRLIGQEKGGVCTLLCGFYLRLLGTVLALFLVIVTAGLSPIGVVAGLSTIIVTFVVWTGKYIVTQQHKEA